MRRLFVRAFCGLLFVAGLPAVSWGQDDGRSSSPYGVSPAMPYSGGTASYLPYGTNAGGFVPYSPGPTGGLGVQPRRMSGPSSTAAGVMSSMTRTPSLGRPRAFAPLEPIRRIGLGAGGGMAGGPMIQRSTPARRMGGMPRPSVGNYPFRQPPSLIAPGSSAPAMSM